MGKLGRFACIFTPMALTVASLVCLVLVFTGGLSKGTSTLSNLYFFKANTANFTANPNTDLIKGTNLDSKFLSALEGARASNDLKDFYQVYLWNYCSGDIDGTTGKETITYCSPRQANYWFNPVEVWGLENTAADKAFPKALQDGLKIYQKVTKWMFTAYVVALIATAAEIVVGFFGLCSRWGSCVTAIISGVSSGFVIAASATSTALFATLTGSVDTALKPYGIDGIIGTKMLATTWLATAFSLGAGLFWLLSMCCCSGQSKDKKRVTVEKTPYTYERVGSPAFGGRDQQQGVVGGHGGAVPLRDMRNSAYEPFRHDSRV